MKDIYASDRYDALLHLLQKIFPVCPDQTRVTTKLIDPSPLFRKICHP